MCVYVCMCACVYVSSRCGASVASGTETRTSVSECVCMCVCVESMWSERSERNRDENERQRVCMHVCTYVCECLSVEYIDNRVDFNFIDLFCLFTVLSFSLNCSFLFIMKITLTSKSHCRHGSDVLREHSFQFHAWI